MLKDVLRKPFLINNEVKSITNKPLGSQGPKQVKKMAK